jgi:hypothetical protein
MQLRNLSFGFLAGLLFTALTASAQVFVSPAPTLTISTGYSNVQTQRANDLFYTHDGAYVDFDASWRLPVVVPLQAGIGITGSGYWDRQSIFNANNNGGYYDNYDHLYSDLGFFEIEPRLGFRFGASQGFFITPRAGAGLLISNYAVDQAFTDNAGNTYINTVYHTGAAFELRPAVQAGYAFGPFSAGVEGSYMWSWGNFGGFGRHAEEYRVGAFFKFTF